MTLRTSAKQPHQPTTTVEEVTPNLYSHRQRPTSSENATASFFHHSLRHHSHCSHPKSPQPQPVTSPQSSPTSCYLRSRCHHPQLPQKRQLPDSPYGNATVSLPSTTAVAMEPPFTATAAAPKSPPATTAEFESSHDHHSPQQLFLFSPVQHSAQDTPNYYSRDTATTKPTLVTPSHHSRRLPVLA